MAPELLALQERLQHPFSDPALLERALTHRSYGAAHNERLEFLGDSVLNLAVSSLLYQRLATLAEGDLSRVRANLVRQETLHDLALRLQLPALLRLGDGEAKAGGRTRASILADALEALIGAVYLDAGYAPAQALVQRLYQGVEITPHMRAAARDAKTALQEWLQARKICPPRYAVLATSGAAHRQSFDVECSVAALGQSARGAGSTRRAGEQAAAAALLARLTAPAEKRKP